MVKLLILAAFWWIAKLSGAEKISFEYAPARMQNVEIRRCFIPEIRHGAVQYFGSIVLPDPGTSKRVQPIGALMVLHCEIGYAVNGVPGHRNQSAFCMDDGSFQTPLGQCLPEMTTTAVPTTIAAAPAMEPLVDSKCFKQFTCKNGQCLPFEFVGDGHDDCGDNSDESDPDFGKSEKSTENAKVMKSVEELHHIELGVAAARGDLMTIRHLLLNNRDPTLPTGGLDINFAFNSDFNSPLCLGVKRGSVLLRAIACNQNTTVVKALIGYGANVTARDGHGWTALMFAAYHSNIDVMRLLLDRGVDLELKAKSGCCPGYSALMVASLFARNIQTLQLLMIRGANLETRDNIGNTPLIAAAAEEGKLDIVKSLLDKGADIDARNFRDETALVLAGRNQRLETIKLLLRREADRHGCTHFLCRLYKR